MDDSGLVLIHETLGALVPETPERTIAVDAQLPPPQHDTQPGSISIEGSWIPDQESWIADQES